MRTYGQRQVSPSRRALRKRVVVRLISELPGTFELIAPGIPIGKVGRDVPRKNAVFFMVIAWSVNVGSSA